MMSSVIDKILSDGTMQAQQVTETEIGLKAYFCYLEDHSLGLVCYKDGIKKYEYRPMIEHWTLPSPVKPCSSSEVEPYYEVSFHGGSTSVCFDKLGNRLHDCYEPKLTPSTESKA